MQLGNGFALVYAVTSKTSFQVIRDTYESILRVKEHNAFPAVIIGNKIDLASEREVETKGDFVFGINLSFIEGKELAKSLHLPFFESSGLFYLNSIITWKRKRESMWTSHLWSLFDSLENGKRLICQNQSTQNGHALYYNRMF